MSDWKDCGTFWSFTCGDAEVTLEPRPSYCDRGRWIGKAHRIATLDGQDAFPRYYMDLSRAKLELQEWLEWRLISEDRATVQPNEP